MEVFDCQYPWQQLGLVVHALHVGQFVRITHSAGQQCVHTVTFLGEESLPCKCTTGAATKEMFFFLAQRFVLGTQLASVRACMCALGCRPREKLEQMSAPEGSRSHTVEQMLMRDL